MNALKDRDPKVLATVVAAFKTIAGRKDLQLMMDMLNDTDARIGSVVDRRDRRNRPGSHSASGNPATCAGPRALR